MQMRVALAAVLLLLTACSGGSDEVRVTQAELLDFEQELPRDAVGVDLEEFAPDEEVAFCDAVASTSGRWIDDALFPMQFWLDTFTAVGDAPDGTQPAIDRLRAFVEARLRWSLGSGGERPVRTESLNADLLTLADAAITGCPDLPLVVGLPGATDAPTGWDDFTADRLAAHCESIRQGVVEGVEEFVATVGRQPRHQIEMEPALVFFVSSDWHGVTLDEAGQAIVVTVPGGGCDLT